MDILSTRSDARILSTQSYKIFPEPQNVFLTQENKKTAALTSGRFLDDIAVTSS
jgi:hypothetical protein